MAERKPLWRRRLWFVANLVFDLGFGSLDLYSGGAVSLGAGAIMFVLAGWWLSQLTTAEPQRQLLDSYRDLVDDQSQLILRALTREARRRV